MMDPNVTLEEIRRLIQEGDKFMDEGLFELGRTKQELAIVKFNDLDYWLTEKKGFLPSDWERHALSYEE